MGCRVTVTFEGGLLAGKRMSRSLSKLTGVIVNPVEVGPRQYAGDKYRRSGVNNRGDVVYVLFEGPSLERKEPIVNHANETPPPAGEPAEADPAHQTSETTGDPAFPSGGHLPADPEPTEAGPSQ